MSERFVPVPFNDFQIHLSKGLVKEAQLLEAYILSLTCKSTRELSLALTKLEECVMWANRAIAVGPQLEAKHE